jgi:hypothetical protein
MFQGTDIISAAAGVAKLLIKFTDQKYLTYASWYRTTSPTRQGLIRLHTAYPSLDTLTSLQTSPDKPFDPTHKVVIGHQLNAFLTLLPITEEYVSASHVLVFEGTPWPAYSSFPGILYCVSMQAES